MTTPVDPPSPRLVFKKLEEAASDASLLDAVEAIRKEGDAIAEIRELIAELESRDETTYSST